MAGILDSIDNLLGTRLGLLVSEPRAAMQQINQQAGAFNQASLLATQAERNAMRGRPITPEQAAAKQYVNKVNEDLAMGFAGTTKLPFNMSLIKNLFGKTKTINPESVLPIENQNFSNWFDNGAIKQRMYHGTWVNDIEAFRPGRANATFLSPDPKFASEFSVKAPSGNPNVLPVYTNVKQPFDYENASHIKKLIESYKQLHNEPIISAKESLKKSSGVPILEQIKQGAWSFIENNKVQDAIKNAGFDAFYVKENGIKNLGVYAPEQIKSVFNRGTFDPKDPRILYGGGLIGSTQLEMPKNKESRK